MCSTTMALRTTVAPSNATTSTCTGNGEKAPKVDWLVHLLRRMRRSGIFYPRDAKLDDFMVEDSDKDFVPLESRTGQHEKRLNVKTIVADVDAIAKYLRYESPEGDMINYPCAELIESDIIISDLYPTVHNFGVPPHKRRKFRDTYRVLNQVVHYNLYPHRAENKPSRKSAEVMYVFMNDADYRANWARFVFEQLVDFKGDTFGTARLPFSCMITTFLRQKGISKGVYEKLEEPSPKIITKAELKNSKSQSKVSIAGTSAGPSAFVPPEPSLWTKEKSERKKLAREVGELKHELNWHTRYIESTTDEKYEAPLRVEDAESEEEVLFGPGDDPGGQ
ncbi:hypothetical protein RHSIM_Rhsim01G0154400 [Rhododendron simsii]|uniref:Uncharacterized protein n=1 Tax=Rhododendron simsii TaxID=118357 RepID=A0A834HH47_RHOSS|nr:hypothetical protein RHSIM_Rhsim01G0154400 [Rhododendron simsii]